MTMTDHKLSKLSSRISKKMSLKDPKIRQRLSGLINRNKFSSQFSQYSANRRGTTAKNEYAHQDNSHIQLLYLTRADLLELAEEDESIYDAIHNIKHKAKSPLGVKYDYSRLIYRNIGELQVAQ